MQNLVKTLHRLVLLICSVALLGGCASKVKVDSTINMPSRSGLALEHVSINRFKGDQFGIKGNVLSAKIKSALMNLGYTNVHGNSPYVLVGEISPSRIERKSWSETFKGEKETWRSYHASIQQSLTVAYNVVYGQRTLNSGSETFSYNEEKSSGDNTTKANGMLRPDSEIADILTDQAAEYIVKQISPYSEKVKLNYLSGEDDNIELGIEYVKKQRLDQAFSIFGQVAQNSGSIEDQAKAWHNQGLVKLMQGEHAQAYELMSKANLIDPRNLDILDSMKEVEDYKVLNDAHKKQMRH